MTAVGTASAQGTAAPRQLIVTVFGLYGRGEAPWSAGATGVGPAGVGPAGVGTAGVGPGWMSVSSLVRLLAALGVDEPAVRSSISRLKRRGLLDAQRRGGAAGYALTPAAHEILVEGDARIFGRRRATTADGWVLVVFSVPESERERRHTLRTQLARLGFGTAAPGVWVAPGHLADEVGEVLRRLGLDGYVELFRGEHLGAPDPAVAVRSWWDLDGLQARYAEFLRCHQRPGAEPGSDAEAFADYVRLVTDWRRLPYADPGLPLELLPPGWAGERAAELFVERGERLAGPALAHARSLIEP